MWTLTSLKARAERGSDPETYEKKGKVDAYAMLEKTRIGWIALAVEVSNLRKHYGNIRVVDGVSFTVDEGEIFGLLGPNGAG